MRSYAEALAWIRGQVTNPSQDWHVLCQSVSRQAVGAQAWAASAREAFNSTPANHKHTSWPPPAGSIAYWGQSDVGFGHATFVGEGVFFSNDIRRRGKIDTVPITTRPQDAAFAAQWGLPFRGWIDWTPSGAINLKPKPVPAPKPAPKPQPAPVVPTGSGPKWTIDFLRAMGCRPEPMRAWFAIIMRESGGRAGLTYPAGAPGDGDWARSSSPYWDTGVLQVNNRHLGEVRAMFGPAADMRLMLDPAKAWRFAQRYLSWSDWGLRIAADGTPSFDWTGWPAGWVARYAKDSEAGFRHWWDAFPSYFAGQTPPPAPIPPPTPPKPSTVTLAAVLAKRPDAVKVVQIALGKVLGVTVAVDGKWGPQTQAAYDKFRTDKLHLSGQAAHGTPGRLSLTRLGRLGGFLVR